MQSKTTFETKQLLKDLNSAMRIYVAANQSDKEEKLYKWVYGSILEKKELDLYNSTKKNENIKEQVNCEIKTKWANAHLFMPDQYRDKANTQMNLKLYDKILKMFDSIYMENIQALIGFPSENAKFLNHIVGILNGMLSTFPFQKQYHKGNAKELYR